LHEISARGGRTAAAVWPNWVAGHSTCSPWSRVARPHTIRVVCKYDVYLYRRGCDRWHATWFCRLTRSRTTR